MLGAEPFTPEHERQLIEYWSKRRYAERNIAILTLGIQTGFRITAILSLRRRDVLKNGNMVDRIYMQRYNTKGGKGIHKGGVHGRSIPITKKTKDALWDQLRWLDAHGYTDPNDFMFQTQRAGNEALNGNGYWRTLYDAKNALGWTWKLSTHSMRKTFAARIYQNLLDKGENDALRILQAGLGHENINNTIKYLSFKEDGLIDAINEVFGA